MTIKVLPGRFVKGFIGLAAGVLALAGLASAEVVVVAPTQMGNWSFATVDGNGDACAPSTGTCGSGSMVSGPATPPLGVGSANLQTGPGGGDGEGKIDSSDLNGISLGALTSLSYSTYDTTNNGQQFPYFKLYLTWGVNGADSDAIYFEPPYQTPAASGDPNLVSQGATQMDTWQTWNPLAGDWWDDDNECKAGSSEPGKQGVCSLSELSSLLGVSLNDITISGANAPDGDGLSIRVGGASPGDNFNGNVDNVTLGISGADTTYDFEPAVPASTPEPGTIALFGVGLLLLGAARRKTLSGRR